MSWELSAEQLSPVEGVKHCKFVDGMRELAMYEINQDKYRVRWDSIIKGCQYTVSKWMPEGYENGVEFFCSTERSSSRALLLDLAMTGIESEVKIVRKP